MDKTLLLSSTNVSSLRNSSDRSSYSNRFSHVLKYFAKITKKAPMISQFPTTLLAFSHFFLLRISQKYFNKLSSFLRIWSHFLKKSLMENFIFRAVWMTSSHILITNQTFEYKLFHKKDISTFFVVRMTDLSLWFKGP